METEAENATAPPLEDCVEPVDKPPESDAVSPIAPTTADANDPAEPALVDDRTPTLAGNATDAPSPPLPAAAVIEEEDEVAGDVPAGDALAGDAPARDGRSDERLPLGDEPCRYGDTTVLALDTERRAGDGDARAPLEGLEIFRNTLSTTLPSGRPTLTLPPAPPPTPTYPSGASSPLSEAAPGEPGSP